MSNEPFGNYLGTWLKCYLVILAATSTIAPQIAAAAQQAPDQLANALGGGALNATFDAFVDRLRVDLAVAREAGARLLVERLALALQASVLLRAGSPAATLFIRSRLGGEHGLAFGTLPADVDEAHLLARALPA